MGGWVGGGGLRGDRRGFRGVIGSGVRDTGIQQR